MPEHLIDLGDVVVDLDRQRAWRDGAKVQLSGTETALIRFLHEHGGEAASRDELLAQVWGYKEGLRTRAVDHAITRLRKKLEPDPSQPRLLISVYGKGYALTSPTPPPGRALPAPHLPADEPALIGRLDELKALRRAFARGVRLVTLHGFGGAGKTRLAIAFAHARHQRGGAVAFCALASVRTRGHLFGVVGHAIGLGRLGGDLSAQGALLADRLSTRDAPLLVLDNLEHLVELCADDLTAWSEGGAKILVTSQRTVGAEGELVVALEPLPVTDSVVLLAGRSGLSDDGGLAEVAARLEGVPLALELAAGRLRWMSPTQLLSRLEDHLRLLAGPGSGRHATMRAAIAWSWDLLAPGEQQALARCAAFASDFSVEAAEAVLEGLDMDPLQAIETLSSRCLLRRANAPGRLGMHNGIRTFAVSEAPEATEAAAGLLRSWLLEHPWMCTGIGDEVFDSESRAWRALEAPHLLAMFEHFVDSAPIEATRCLLAVPDSVHFRRDSQAARGLLAQGADAVAPLDPALESETRARLSRFCRVAGDPEGALTSALRAHELASRCADPQLRGRAAGDLATALTARGELAEATELLRAAAEDLEAAGQPLQAAMQRGNLAVVALIRGDLREAEAGLEATLDTLAGRADAINLARFRTSLGHVQLAQGNTGAARHHYTLAERLFASEGDQVGRGQVMGALAQLHLDEGALDEARDQARQAIEVNGRVGNLRSVGVSRLVLGCAELESGDLSAADEAFRSGRALFESLADPRWTAIADTWLGRVQLVLGELTGARARLERAGLELSRARDLRSEASCLCSLAVVCWRLQEVEAAHAHLDAAASLAEDPVSLAMAALVDAAVEGRPLPVVEHASSELRIAVMALRSR